MFFKVSRRLFKSGNIQNLISRLQIITYSPLSAQKIFSSAMASFSYPAVKRGPVVENLHGKTVSHEECHIVASSSQFINLIMTVADVMFCILNILIRWKTHIVG